MNLALIVVIVLSSPIWGAILLGIFICLSIYVSLFIEICITLIFGTIGIFTRKPKKKTKEIV